MALAFDPAVDLPVDALVALFNDAFAGYVGGDIELDRASFARFCARQGVDLALSVAAREEDAPVALGLVARRGWSSRLAAMAVARASQGRGVGAALLDRLLDEAAARGDRRYELEVIVDNPRGVRLYEGRGFRTVQHLLGFEAQPGALAAAAPQRVLPELEEVDPYEVARAVEVHGAPDLPWQAAGASLCTLGPPVRGVRCGPARALFGPPQSGVATLLALVVERRARRRGHGRRLLAALGRAQPEVGWRVPAITPEALAPFFEACGFARGGLEQLHLARPVAATMPADESDGRPNPVTAATGP